MQSSSIFGIKLTKAIKSSKVIGHGKLGLFLLLLFLVICGSFLRGKREGGISSW